MMKKFALFVSGCLAAVQTSAQEWDGSFTTYLWGAGIDGSASIGPLSADASLDFADLLDVLSGAALFRVEAARENHGVFADITYLNLEADRARDALGGSIGLELKSWVVEAAYFHRLSARHGLEVGARYWDFEAELIPVVPAPRTRKTSWTDGFVGYRTGGDVSANWAWLARANVGAGGSDLAAGLQLDFRRRLESGNRFDVGYRLLDIDYKDGSGLNAVGLDMMLHGVTLGFTFD